MAIVSVVRLATKDISVSKNAMISHMAIDAKASAGTVKTTFHVITLQANVVVAKLGFI